MVREPTGIAVLAIWVLVLATAACTSGAGTTGAGTTGAGVTGSGTTGGGSPGTTAHAPGTPVGSPGKRVRPVREVAGTCPYITNQEVADIEGSRVGRSTVVTSRPPGCRFYFLYGDRHMTTRIAVQKYPDTDAAFNRVARTGGPHAFTTPGIGAAAVLYQTRFYAPDGNRDWACSFATGRLVVTINTDQTDPSANARNLARAVVGRM